ncbi:protein ANTI-SILENCING 1-like isoform X2 [Apium graveolens]|uniref:protein ANTI-SILENCING 1-like isoform X2 n=1 Tax=Apium graveolens TaxID=4045 RepID=UPI003D7A21E3
MQFDMAERENVKDLEFKWGQKIGADCLEKEGQFYESFTYDGTEYTLYDCVYVDKEGEPEPYLGKLIGIWETVDRTKKVNVQWFFRPTEISKWLADQTPLQKEIFLATGEGIGLSNVNPLEAIAGKCYVICTSEDRRNRQPSKEETKSADYIFYRTFDVGRCTLSEKIDDSVGGLAVKYVFNREGKNMNRLQTHGSSKVEGVSSTLACKGEKKLLILNSSDEFETDEHHVKSVVIKDVNSVSVESGWVPGEGSDYKFGNNSNVFAVTNEPKQVCASDQKVKSREVNSTMDGVKKVTNNKSRDKEKLSFDAMQDKPTKTARTSNSTITCEDEISKSAKNLLIQGEDSMMCALASKDETKSEDKNLSLNRGISVAKKGGSEDGLIGILKGGSSNKIKKAVTFDDANAKDFMKNAKNSDRNSRFESGSTSKEWVHENSRKFSNNTMSKLGGKEMENREMEIATRSKIDKGKWWTTTNKMRNAAKGTTLLIWNLDPKYTSKDVEEVINDALQTSCAAIMLPRTKISSPHSGQAILKFNNTETTQRVLRKLSEGCLMLPNGRPLVATEAPPSNSTEGQCTYFGHLVIDSIKLQGDARDAVSTSHCSQPNTIEYEMAMEWCLLQTQSDRWWEGLYKRHDGQMRRLKANIKSK